jgi:hypothetical protein
MDGGFISAAVSSPTNSRGVSHFGFINCKKKPRHMSVTGLLLLE